MKSLQGPQKALSVLIVEDDKAALESLQQTIVLKYPDFTVRRAENGLMGLELFKEYQPDLVITDIDMPGMNGIQMVGHIKGLSPGVRVIAATAISATHYLIDSIKIGINRYLLKPIELRLLFEAIDDCVASLTMEQQIKAQNDLIGELSGVIEQSTDLVFIVNASGGIEYFNPRVTEVAGYTREELAGQQFHTLSAEDPSCEGFQSVWDKVLSQSSWDGELMISKKGGDLFCAELSISPFDTKTGRDSKFVAVMQDVTERKKAAEEHRRMEEQMLHAQKLESLGVLAGGIAHDFNNILMSVIGNADLALMRINKESPAVENLRQIERAAARAADLAKQMLAYSGKGKFVTECLDLNLLLEEMLHMLEVSISKKAVLRLNLTSPLPTVEADATQLRQVVMNLVINASEAIGDKSGVIAITTGCMDCNKNYLKNVWLSDNLGEGFYVYLEVADTGCGMPKETLARIFDPFFTTKFSGRGLGMAAVLGIVKGHRGAIRVYSEPGKGSTLKILLPACGRPAEVFEHDSSNDGWQGSGTVLLVDDEETVRGIGCAMLKELGFVPITAEDGREALTLFKQRPDISFVIMDLTMPHLDGEQCFRELRQLSPEVKVIMTSGYNEHEVTQKFAGKGLSGFMQKPYNIAQLKKMIVALELQG
jgi:two-component system, cell cycle sensor histidine kinase and response regulator CckA